MSDNFSIRIQDNKILKFLIALSEANDNLAQTVDEGKLQVYDPFISHVELMVHNK